MKYTSRKNLFSHAVFSENKKGTSGGLFQYLIQILILKI